MLVLHIGLPKTGTTFLQHQILGRSPGIRLVHRTGGEAEKALCMALRRLGPANRLAAAFLRGRILARLVPIAADAALRPVIISDENISVRPYGFWLSRGPEPSRLAGRLAELAAALPAPPKVVIGIRRQDQWLASRYAESSKLFPHFSQADFERRMADLVAAPSLPVTMRWLDYAAVRAAFADAIGPDNVLMLSQERLAAAQGETLGALGAFLGGVRLARPKPRPDRQGHRNVLSTGENSWRMRGRGDGTPLHLSEGVEQALRRRFAASNRALAAALPFPWEP